jgi:type IX secretion system substrate protein
LYGFDNTFPMGENNVNLTNIEVSDYSVSDSTNESSILERVEFKIYPNPNNGQFTIELPSSGNQQIEVTDLLGKQVYSQTATQSTAQINLQGYPKGIYIVKVNSGEKTFVEKIVVQ